MNVEENERRRNLRAELIWRALKKKRKIALFLDFQVYSDLLPKLLTIYFHYFS